VTRNAGLRVAYGYGESHDGLQAHGPAIGTHNIDLGLTYDRPISASRRTVLAFGSGTSISGSQNNRSSMLVLDASVARSLGRAWFATVAYHRGLTFLEGFGGPVYADALQFRVGPVTDRISLTMSGGLADGQQGFSASGRNYLTFTTASELRIALSRQLWLTTQYGNQFYRFNPTNPAPFNLHNELGRQSLRIGLSGNLGR
jgi:hypothetical protein